MHSEGSKVCYYQPKNQQNQHPKLCTIFISKIDPDVLIVQCTKINTFTFYKPGRGGGGGDKSRSQKIDSPVIY